MKVVTPEISWHERDPIYSVDFQPGQWPIQRLASGGVDKIVRIWQMAVDAEGKGDFEFLSNLRRHTATVNVVRFSKDGNILATAGDDTAIILWKLSDVPTPANNIFADDDGEEDKETWVCYKTLRGHLGDVADLSWSKDNRYLVSGSVDNSAIVWDVSKGAKLAMFNEHKSYVQGVTFDPLANFVATLSADRSLRIYNTSSKSCVHNVSKMSLPPPPPTTTDETVQPDPQAETKPRAVRIFHDDSLRSFFRRLEFSPDGQLLLAPAACVEVAEKSVNATLVFSRAAFSKPAMYLPCGEKSSTVVRFNPQLFQLRPVDNKDESEKESQPEWEKKKSLFCLPYRMVYAVATEDCVLLYDTQQTLPIGLLKNIHYHQLSDLSWTSNGRSLIVSSTDGFCSVATFEENELGLPYTVKSDDKADEVTSMETDKASTDILSKRAPSSPSDNKDQKTPDRKVKPEKKVDEGKSTDDSMPLVEGSKLPSPPGKTESTSSKDQAVADSVNGLTIKETMSPSGQTKSTSPAAQTLEMSASKGDGKKKRIQFTTLSLNK